MDQILLQSTTTEVSGLMPRMNLTQYSFQTEIREQVNQQKTIKSVMHLLSWVRKQSESQHNAVLIHQACK